VRTHVVILTVVLFALCVGTAVAADISGKWIAQVPGRDGTPQEQVFVFKVAGGTLTGTVSGARGDQEISGGTVSGDDVSFVVIRKFQDMEMKTTYKGKVAGNEIKFTSVRPGRDGAAGTPVEFTAKRAS
jgi:hypothetical protein